MEKASKIQVDEAAVKILSTLAIADVDMKAELLHAAMVEYRKRCFLRLYSEAVGKEEVKKAIKEPQKKGTPEMAIGHVSSEFKGERKRIGTWALIGRNIMLTAARTLFSLHDKAEAKTLEFYSQAGEKIEPLKCTVSSIHYPKEYTKGGEGLEHDYGIIILNEMVGDERGFLHINAITPKKLKNKSVAVYGPDAKMTQQVKTEAIIESAEEKSITLNADIKSAQGEVVVYEDKGKNYAVGLNRNEAKLATYISQEREAVISKWVEEGFMIKAANVAYELTKSVPSKIVSAKLLSKITKKMQLLLDPGMKEVVKATAGTFGWIAALPWRLIGMAQLLVFRDIPTDPIDPPKKKASRASSNSNTQSRL